MDKRFAKKTMSGGLLFAEKMQLRFAFHLTEAVRTSLADEKDSSCPVAGETLRIVDIPLWAIVKVGEI